MALFELQRQFQNCTRDLTFPGARHAEANGRNSASSFYRPEIDGLRAIAVLGVVFYHFKLPFISGGFVGVDIFFVISGFLIGSLLWRELALTGTVSLPRFFIRRVLRIFPAFAVMTTVCGLLGYFFLLPFEFREYGKTLIASLTYLSNVQFFRDAGYFDAAAETKPLLHTWSLSLEEQFYVFLPVILIAFAHYRRFTIGLLGVMAVTSLILCVAVTPHSQTAAFYLLPFRLWELLAGVLLAVHVTQANTTRWHGSWMSWGGILLLLTSMLILQPSARFPGYLAMMPVLGVVMIIANGRDDNPVNRFLTARASVLIGLVSYSLYLWHWPVLVLSRIYLGEEAVVVPLVASFAAAGLSWRFVEGPFRHVSGVKSYRVFAAAFACTASLAVAGAVIYAQNGMPWRFSSAVQAHVSASADFIQEWSQCTTSRSGTLQDIEICPIGKGGAPTFLVWGDSHARAFKEGLSLLADETGASGVLIWRGGCPPLFDIVKKESAATRQQDAECATANARIRNWLDETPGLDKILLIGRWSYYADGHGVGRDAANLISLTSTRSDDAKLTQGDIFAAAVSATVSALAMHRQVFVLQQVPEIPNYDSREVARLLVASSVEKQLEVAKRLTVAQSEIAERAGRADVIFETLADQSKLIWLPSWAPLCDTRQCSVLQNGRSYYFDNNHLTNSAAKAIRQIFSPVMRPENAAILQARSGK